MHFGLVHDTKWNILFSLTECQERCHIFLRLGLRKGLEYDLLIWIGVASNRPSMTYGRGRAVADA